MLPARYLEPIVSFFHYLRLDNWRAVVVAVNLRKNAFGFPSGL